MRAIGKGNMKRDVMERSCDDDGWMELANDRVQWLSSVLPVMDWFENFLKPNLNALLKI
jgi:hypothetical protein